MKGLIQGTPSSRHPQRHPSETRCSEGPRHPNREEAQHWAQGWKQRTYLVTKWGPLRTRAMEPSPEGC